MRFSRPALLAVLCVFLPATVSGQTGSAATSPPTSDPQAVALLQKSLAALASGASITDVTLTGTARRIAGSEDETGTATLEAASAGDSRVELSFASGNRVEIRNHSALPLAGSLPPGTPPAAAQTMQPVGEWIGPDGTGHAMAGHNVMADPTWFFPVLTIERILTAQNYVVTYVGQETFDGTPVLHISASEQFPQAPPSIASLLKRLSELDFYLDPNTALPVALAFNTHPDNDALVDIAVKIEFSDYRSLGGVEAPYHVQRYVNNGLVLDLQIANTTLNSGLSTSAFALN